MSLTIELPAEVEERIQTLAARTGRNVSEIVQELLRREFALPEPEDDITDLARRTALASEATLRKLWDTPEEDEAWRHL